MWGKSSKHLDWSENHSEWVLSWWREFYGWSLIEFWWHILSDCWVETEALQYHLCSIYRRLWGLVVVRQPRSQASPFFWSLGFIQYNTRKRKSANTGKAWEHVSREWCPVDARWTYSIEHSNDSQDSWSSQDRQYSASLVRNSLYCLLHTSWLMGTSTLRPPRVHQTLFTW